MQLTEESVAEITEQFVKDFFYLITKPPYEMSGEFFEQKVKRSPTKLYEKLLSESPLEELKKMK